MCIIITLEASLSPTHCLKSARIRGCSGPDFPVFGLNTEIYSANLHIQCECWKKGAKKTPNTDTFYTVTNIPTYKTNTYGNYDVRYMQYLSICVLENRSSEICSNCWGTQEL